MSTVTIGSSEVEYDESLEAARDSFQAGERFEVLVQKDYDVFLKRLGPELPKVFRLTFPEGVVILPGQVVQVHVDHRVQLLNEATECVCMGAEYAEPSANDLGVAVQEVVKSKELLS